MACEQLQREDEASQQDVPASLPAPRTVDAIEQKRKPRGCLQLVYMLDQRAHVSAERIHARGDKRRRFRKAQHVAREQMKEERRQDDVQDDGSVDRQRGRQKDKYPVERIEHAGLPVGEQRHTHIQVRIPQRQPPLKQRVVHRAAVWVKVCEDIDADHDLIGQRKLPEKYNRERRQRRARKNRRPCRHQRE